MDGMPVTPDTTPRHSWLDRLSEYVDGELSRAERRALEQHLSGCTRCSAALDDLRLVAERAKAWNAPAEPARDLWPGIAARLEPRARVMPRRWTRWLAPRLAAAAALVAALALAWGLFVGHQPAVRRAAVRPSTSPGYSTPPFAADRDYETTVASLQREVAARLTHDPHVVEVLDENLATLDVAIANYREALAADPTDATLRRRLAQARQRKIDVLRQAVSLAEEGNE
jgi:hypothetical protein